MSRLYRVILIFSLIVAIMFLQQPISIAATNINYTNQLTASDLFKRGVYEALIGNYQVAIENFNQVIQIRPNDATAYANKGLARAAIGEQKGAIADFNSALHRNPNLEVAYYNRGYIRFELQDYQAALTDFDRAISLDPQNVAEKLGCGSLEKLGGRWGNPISKKPPTFRFASLEKLGVRGGNPLSQNTPTFRSPNIFQDRCLSLSLSCSSSTRRCTGSS